MSGLRERKKEAASGLIAEVAMTLFDARGFDAVTYADIAEAANVATKTVFNYFPTKEDLVLTGRRRHENALIDAVSNRAPDMGLLAPVLNCTLSVLQELEALPAGRRDQFRRVLSASPALMDRFRSRTRETERTLAGLLASQMRAPPGDLRPAIAASALMSLWHLAFFADGGWSAQATSDTPANERIRQAAQFLADGLGPLGL